MRLSRIGTSITLLALAALLAGCCGGGSTTVEKSTTVIKDSRTKGERLTDLQKAYESGAIDEKEYNRLKQEIINEGK